MAFVFRSVILSGNKILKDGRGLPFKDESILFLLEKVLPIRLPITIKMAIVTQNKNLRKLIKFFDQMNSTRPVIINEIHPILNIKCCVIDKSSMIPPQPHDTLLF